MVHAKNKGKRGEDEVAKIFQGYGFNAERTGFMQSSRANLGSDVTLTDLPQYWIEVKRGSQTRPLEALQQATESCGNQIPVAICRNDRSEATVCMYMSDYLDLLQENKVTKLETEKVILSLKLFMKHFVEKHREQQVQPSLFE